MICVRDLVGIKSLGLTLRAGAEGGHRLISWAHTVDLPDPWRWVSAGNLVMTTGGGLPKSPEDQAAWLEKLADTNASALVVALQPGAPELSSRLLEAADQLLFPVIEASFELEFVKLSRQVIESVVQSQNQKFKSSEHLFQTYAYALSEAADFEERLRILADKLQLDLAIEDARSKMIMMTSCTPPPSVTSASLLVENVPIAGRSRANLLIRRRDGKVSQDVLLIKILVGLLGIELERLMIHRDTQRSEGTSILKSLARDETDIAAVLPMLKRRGLAGKLVAFAVKSKNLGDWKFTDIHHAPGLHNPSPLFLEEDVLVGLAADDQEIFEALTRHLGPETVMGISGPVTASTGFREGLRQARLALTQAAESQADILRYGEAQADFLLAPKTLAEARALVACYLGALIEYDRLNAAALISTLAKFLDNNSSLKATAIDLGIHRQTLIYRLKLIEQITGLKPTTTNGTAKFWLALSAGRAANLLAR